MDQQILVILWTLVRLTRLSVTQQLKSREPQVELLYLRVFKIENSIFLKKYSRNFIFVWD